VRTPVAATVDDYIGGFPREVQRALTQVRRVLRKAVPGVVERISYGIVKFELDGKYVLYMAGWPAHVGLYPVMGAAAKAFENELAPFRSGKATLRFPLARPRPVDLIRRLAEYRVRELREVPTRRPKAPVRTVARKSR
jgi:uncharacterized protein YdhG (YjbR/CyaY superfamily)